MLVLQGLRAFLLQALQFVPLVFEQFALLLDNLPPLIQFDRAGLVCQKLAFVFELPALLLDCGDFRVITPKAVAPVLGKLALPNRPGFQSFRHEIYRNHRFFPRIYPGFRMNVELGERVGDLVNVLPVLLMKNRVILAQPLQPVRLLRVADIQQQNWLGIVHRRLQFVPNVIGAEAVW